jgi:cell division transport system permease protein
MGRLVFFIQEAARALRRNAAPSGAAVVTIALTVTVLGVLIPALAATSEKTEEVRNQIALKVFLFSDATQAEAIALGKRIEAIPHVSSTEFVSRADAKRILNEKINDTSYRNQVSRDFTLPPSFNVRIDDPDNLEAVRTAMAPVGKGGKPRPISPAIEEIVNSEEQAKAIRAVTGALKIALGAVTVMLLLASLLLIGNTIRLSIYTRRREVEVMRLVGGTAWFIRWPFIIEGIVVGVAGALLAIGVLGAAKATLYDPLADDFNLVAAQEGNVDFAVLVLALVAASVVVSAIGSGITLRRFLRI